MLNPAVAPLPHQELLPKLAAFFAARQVAAYLVGGYVRDALLGRSSHDIDLAVAGDAPALGQALAARLGGVYVPLGQAHGMARVVVNPGPEQLYVDLATLEAPHTSTVEEDLCRRDFTINAMALPLERWDSPRWRQELSDPFDGQEDLRRKRVAPVSPHIFLADPGRLLRAVRLTARLKFMLDPSAARLIRHDAALLSRVAPERARDEFLAILAQDGARGQLEALDRLDLLCRLIPELSATKGVDQPRAHHYWDVWGHLLHCVEFAELVTRGHQNSAIYIHAPWTPELAAHFAQEASDGHNRGTILKLAALFHDIAKPQTKGPDATGRIRFLGHSEMGAAMAERRLTALRVSARGVALVSKMVEEHLRPSQMSQGGGLPTPRAVHRYFRDVGEAAIDTIYLCLADYLAAKGPDLRPDDWINHAKMMAHILQTGQAQRAAARPQRVVTGHDLMRELGLAPGPRIGRLLETVNEAWAANEITTRQQALDLARESLKEPGQE